MAERRLVVGLSECRLFIACDKCGSSYSVGPDAKMSELASVNRCFACGDRKTAMDRYNIAGRFLELCQAVEAYKMEIRLQVPLP